MMDSKVKPHLQKLSIEALREAKELQELKQQQNYVSIEEHPYIIFFNQGWQCVPEFGQRPNNGGSNFYWFYESFHSHVSIKKQDRFLHLFVRDPKSIHFVFNRGGRNWQEFFVHYFQTKKDKDLNYKNGNLHPLPEPSILRSDDVLMPDIIFDFQEAGSHEAMIIFPEQFKGITCKLFTDEHVPIPFAEVPEIVAILPQIKSAFPTIKIHKT